MPSQNLLFWQLRHRFALWWAWCNSFYGLTMSCSAVQRNQHEPPRPRWASEVPLCTSVPFFHPPVQPVVTSSILSSCPFWFLYFHMWFYFSSAKDFLKGKCLTLLYDITVFFFSETVQSRCSIVLPCFVKWQSGKKHWPCTHVFKKRGDRNVTRLRDFVTTGDILQ